MRKLSVTLYAPCLMCIPESYDKSKIKNKIRSLVYFWKV